jgi:hypothetical protein
MAFLRSVLRLLVTANVVSISPSLATLMMEAMRSLETSVLTTAIWCNFSENGILHSCCLWNPESYIALTGWPCSGDVMCLLWSTNWVFISENGIRHSHHRENLKSYIALTGWPCSGDVMCLMWATNWGIIIQNTAFVIVTTVKTSNIT